MLAGPILVAVFLAGVVALVFLTSKLKVHPFLALFVVAISVGLVSGIEPGELIELVIQGFSRMLGYIAIITLSACIIGEVFEKTGAIVTISESILRLLGRSRSTLALGVAGSLVAVPVMCNDTAFIILSPIAQALGSMGTAHYAVISLALAAGAYTSFKLIFPAAPLFPATMFGADVPRVVLLGFLTSLPVFAVGILWARITGRGVQAAARHSSSREEMGKRYVRLPGALPSFGSLTFPIVLIALRSIVGSVLHEALGRG